PRVARRLARKEVLGDALLQAGLFGEQQRSLTVALCSFGAREFRIETAEDDRMNERQRAAGFENPGVDEQLDGFSGLARVEARKPRGLTKLALLEDRERPRELPGRVGQPVQPENDRAADRLSADSLDVPGGLCDWS